MSLMMRLVKAHTSQRPPQTAGAYTGYLSMKHAWEYCYSPLDGMLVHLRVTPPPPPQSACRMYRFIYLGEVSQSGVKFLV